VAISKQQIHDFIRGHGNAVVSSVAANGTPQSAFMFVAVTQDLELIFYTLETNRKCANLRRDPRVAATIGGPGENQTLQYEGVADEPQGVHLDEIKKIYLENCPDAADRVQWPGLVFFRVRPLWLRFSEYGRSWRVEEISFPENPPPPRPTSWLEKIRGH
jgi:hypothetical protein